jgi:hypothetical protein
VLKLFAGFGNYTLHLLSLNTDVNDPFRTASLRKYSKTVFNLHGAANINTVNDVSSWVFEKFILI